MRLLSTHRSEAEPRSGRGSEHGGIGGIAARSCTSGIDRRSRTKLHTQPWNECEMEISR